MPRRTFAEHAPDGLYFRNDKNTSLGAHKDGGAHVDEVVGVTLHENPDKTSVLQFAKGDCFYDMPTPHGSVYIMTGSSYHDWTHARKKNSKQGGNVISFTFRTPSACTRSRNA